MKLFDVPVVKKEVRSETCKTCIHLEPWQCGARIIHYCCLLKSNRTQNGQLKVKCKNPACESYVKQINQSL